jgi:pimeloyl-ACP methyl ester carboxylesterase
LFTTNYRNSSKFPYFNQVELNGYIAGLAPSFDYEYREVENPKLREAISKITSDLEENPLADGEQFNLAGYSYGSVVQAQVALKMAKEGRVIDNLILIGSPISDDSELFQELIANKNIRNVIRYDIPNDKLSNPSSILEYLSGAFQNSDDSGPHFDLARPDKETDDRMLKMAQTLKDQGVR